MKENEPFLDKCDCTIIHEDVVERVRGEMPDEELLFDLADLFKRSELCVCDIAALLGMTQSAISHQLRVLKQARLVKSRRAGKVVYYSLDDEHIKAIFNQGLNHIKEK